MDNLPQQDHRLEQAKNIIASILRELSIAEVIYVDDIFEQKYDVEKIIGWMAIAYQKSPEQVISHWPQLEAFAPLDQGFRQTIREQWDSLNAEERDLYSSQIIEICGNEFEFSKDIKGSYILSQFFNGNILFISPSEWEKSKKPEILVKAAEALRYLVLFDHDLHEAKGFDANGGRSGAGLLKDIVSTKRVDADDMDLIICGLLTHTIQDTSHEMPRWREIGAEYQLDLCHFLPLAKQRLHHDDPLIFANGIQKTILNSYCERLKTTLLDVVKESIPNALKKVNEIDVYEFEYMVLRASFHASEWEAFALTRLFQIFEKDEIIATLLKPNTPDNFNKAVKKARLIAQLWQSPVDEVASNTRAIRRQELFECSTTQRFSPLQLGDIFQDHEGQYYILLAQPCDLMVRKEGHRNNKQLTVPMIPIGEIVENATGDDYWRTHAKLEYFFLDKIEPAVVSFGKAIWITADVLDLAVFHPEGRCSLDVTAKSDPPAGLPGWWVWRFDRLIKKYKELASTIVKVEQTINKLENQEEKDFLTPLCAPKFTLTRFNFPIPIFRDNCFNFGLQRILRVREPGSIRLLRMFTLYMSREADDSDFAQVGINWDLPPFYRR